MSIHAGMPARPMSDEAMRERGWNRRADMRVGKTRRDKDGTPGPDRSGDTKARRRLAARASAHDLFTSKLTPQELRAYRRPGSLNKPFPAGKGRHH